MRERRRQYTALVLSGILPGLGQFYLRAWKKGAAFLVAGGAAVWALGQLVSMQDLMTGILPHPLATQGVLVTLLVVFLWSMLDAWRSGARPRT